MYPHYDEPYKEIVEPEKKTSAVVQHVTVLWVLQKETQSFPLIGSTLLVTLDII